MNIILLGDRINGKDITFGRMGYVIVKGKGVLSSEAVGPATNGPTSPMTHWHSARREGVTS
jgi:hypothetical protein